MISLDRISTAVPWPRGLCFYNDELFALARGRHRGAGGPKAGLPDQAGTIFQVDTGISEPVVIGQPVGKDVKGNASVTAWPHSPPLKLWDQNADPPSLDTRTDRPYATLVVHPSSQNFFIGCFSGIDAVPFSKNRTDAIHRFDLRIRRWLPVEEHFDRPGVYYPHHDPATNPPPHGWLNGPDGLVVVEDQLYAVAKDNHCLARYPLDAITGDAEAPPPPGVQELQSHSGIRLSGLNRDLKGPSALAVHGSHLYIGFRTTSEIVRIPLNADGTIASDDGELIALFDPRTSTQDSADLIDMAYSPDDELFVSTARRGEIWNIGKPDPSSPFDGRTGQGSLPTITLRTLTPNDQAKCGNIAFDPYGRLYICSGNQDDPSAPTAGVIYRASGL